MKSKEALNAIHEEAETVSTELAKLTKEELEQVAGGFDVPNDVYNGDIHIYTNDVKDKEKFTPKF